MIESFLIFQLLLLCSVVAWLPSPQFLVQRNCFYRQKSAIAFSKKSIVAVEEPTAAAFENADEEEEDALIKRINAEVLAESGVELDQLINPSKVVNLERDLLKLAKELQTTTILQEKETLEAKISQKQRVLAVEKRAVMRNWLKNLFVIQSVLAAVASLGMVYNAIPGYNLPLSVQVLGFWMWWLFIIPSLR
jgi:hypothetical protein